MEHLKPPGGFWTDPYRAMFKNLRHPQTYWLAESSVPMSRVIIVPSTSSHKKAINVDFGRCSTTGWYGSVHQPWSSGYGSDYPGMVFTLKREDGPIASRWYWSPWPKAVLRRTVIIRMEMVSQSVYSAIHRGFGGGLVPSPPCHGV